MIDLGSFLNDQGVELSRNGKQEEAIACFDKCLALSPNDCAALGNKAIALLKLGKMKEALDCLDKSLQIKSKDPMAWHNKGLVLLNLKKTKEAVRAFENVIKYATPEDGLDLQKEQAIVDNIKSGRARFGR